MKWIIVDLSGLTADRWCDRRWGHVLPEDDRPTFVHEDLGRAEAELCRLTAAHPDGEFVLFASVARGESVREWRGDVMRGHEVWAQRMGMGSNQCIGKMVPIKD